MSNKKPSNFGTAVYIAENHGYDISDEQLISVAKKMNIKPNVLIKNYKNICLINKTIDGLKSVGEWHIEWYSILYRVLWVGFV